MRRNNLLLFALTFSLLSFQPSLANSGAGVGAQNLSCDPVEMAWVSNLTLNGFDLHWPAIPNTNSYQIDAWVNNTAVYSTITPATTVNIALPAPLQVGDLVVYRIYTYCDHGEIGEPFSDEFPIIATEDIVMINPGGIGASTCHCPWFALPVFDPEELYRIYDCPCVQDHLDIYECPMKKAAIQVTYCGFNPPPNPTPLRHFYPNPFSNQLNASIELPQAGVVSLSIVDQQGRTIRSIIKEEYYAAGPLRIEINTTELEKGIYYYVLNLDSDQWLGRLLRM